MTPNASALGPIIPAMEHRVFSVMTMAVVSVVAFLVVMYGPCGRCSCSLSATATSAMEHRGFSVLIIAVIAGVTSPLSLYGLMQVFLLILGGGD
jgi:hypothetical protein